MHLVEFFDRALRDASLDPSGRAAVARQGLQAAEARLRDTPEDPEALAVKGLLLRLLAGLEENASARAALLEDADVVQERAIQARKKRLAGL